MNETAMRESSGDDGVEFAYSFKPSLLGSPHSFSLAEGALCWELGRFAGSTPYARIKRVRLSFRPTTLAGHRFVTEIWADDAPKLTISSTTSHSMVEQRRQDAPYAAFVRELCRRIGAARGQAIFVSGSPPLLYWPGAILCIVFAIALPYIIVKAMLAGSTAGTLIIGGLLTVFGWQMFNTFWRNKPGAFQPDSIPSFLLPRG